MIRRGIRRAATCLALAVLLPQGLVPAARAADPAAEPEAAQPSTDGVRALIVPRREARLSSQITARIRSIGPEPGMAFSKGDALVRFDCALYEAHAKKAEAELLAATHSFDSRKKLSEFNSGSRLELELARADRMRAGAELDAIRATLRECTIHAPFPGRVVARLANAWESVTPGTPLIEIIDERDLDVRIIAPSRWLVWLRAGQRVDIRVEELDRIVAAEIRAIGSRVDSVSQSVEITAGLAGDAAGLKPGMSGVALFPERVR